MSLESRTTPRRPGRPPADGVDQRERLLDTAVACFSRDGIAGTSLRQLARESEVTPAMLHYYFGSKDRLVEAVIAERLMPVLDGLRSHLGSAQGKDAATLLRTLVRGFFATIENHPWLPPLWVREVLCDAGQLRDLIVTRVAPQLPVPVVRQLTEAQARGEINPDLDPRLLFVTLIGLTVFPFAAAPIWRQALSATDIDSDRLLDHTLAFLTHGIGVPNA